MGRYDKLDRLVSEYIRKRDTHEFYMANDNEIIGSNRKGFCITCRRPVNYLDAHCGHYLSRKYLATRFDERNMAIQCPSCNILYYGRPKEFRIALIEKYGEEVVEELEQLKNTTLKLASSDIREMERQMREKIKELESKK